MKKIRIVQFLEELNEKMKRYENEEPDYFWYLIIFGLRKSNIIDVLAKVIEIRAMPT